MAKSETTTPATDEHPAEESGFEMSEAEQRWRELFSAWLRVKAQWADAPQPDAAADRLGERESEIVVAMITAPTDRKPNLLQKIDVLSEYLSHSLWTDHRDTLLLASIRADVEDLS